MMEYDELLDVTGLTCPKPLLFTKKKLATLKSKTVLCILLDDKKSLEDFGFFCKATGHILLGINQELNPIHIFIQTK